MHMYKSSRGGRHLAAGVFFALCGGSAMAGPYLAPTLSLSDLKKYSDVKGGIGFGAAGGYQFETLPVFVEASYLTSGNLKVDDFQSPDLSFQGAKLSYRGEQVFLGLSQKVGKDKPVYFWAKLGYHNFNSKLAFDQITATSNGITYTAQDFSTQQKDRGLSWALGGDWMFTKELGLRAEAGIAEKVHPFPGLSSDEKTKLQIFSIGLVWRPQFGSSTHAAASPVYTNPVSYDSYQAPVAASPYVNTTATPFAVGATAKLAAGTTLRGQPKPNGDLSGTLQTETAVTLQGSSIGAYGDWWLVKGPGIRGWVMASDLLTP